MNKRRLLKLADLLEADAKNSRGIKFDMGDWGSTDDNLPASVSCGTTACAMGLAVVSGAFKRAGLSNASSVPYYILPRFAGYTGFYAASALFDITDDESVFLFSPDSYPDRKQTGADGERFVAKRVRYFVKDRSIAA